MCIPDHFSIKNTDEAYRIIEAHPLGILVTSTDEGLDANHLPFELDAERGRLFTVVQFCLSLGRVLRLISL